MFVNKLTWENPTDYDFSHVVLYVSLDSNFRSNAIKIYTGPANNYDHYLVSSYSYAYYWLRAYDTWGNHSEWYPVSETGGYQVSYYAINQPVLDVLQGALGKEHFGGDFDNDYIITLDAHGRFGAFGLISDPETYESTFAIAVDQFIVYNPDLPANQRQVFTIEEGIVKINGDLLMNGTVWADNVKTNTTISSSNYTSTTGYQLKGSDGSAIFRNLTVTDHNGNILLKTYGGTGDAPVIDWDNFEWVGNAPESGATVNRPDADTDTAINNAVTTVKSEISKSNWRYDGNYTLDSQTSVINYQFSPVPSEYVPYMRLAFLGGDFDGDIRVYCNNNLIFVPDGTSGSVTWYSCDIPNLAINSSADNTISFVLDGGGDGGVIFSVLFNLLGLVP